MRTKTNKEARLSLEKKWKNSETKINRALKRLKGAKIIDLSVDCGIDQHIILKTDKERLVIGANELGVWVERR